jgi:hypothetical protein
VQVHHDAVGADEGVFAFAAEIVGQFGRRDAPVSKAAGGKEAGGPVGVIGMDQDIKIVERPQADVAVCRRGEHGALERQRSDAGLLERRRQRGKFVSQQASPCGVVQNHPLQLPAIRPGRH